MRSEMMYARVDVMPRISAKGDIDMAIKEEPPPPPLGVGLDADDDDDDDDDNDDCKGVIGV